MRQIRFRTQKWAHAKSFVDHTILKHSHRLWRLPGVMNVVAAPEDPDYASWCVEIHSTDPVRTRLAMGTDHPTLDGVRVRVTGLSWGPAARAYDAKVAPPGYMRRIHARQIDRAGGL